MTGLEEIGRKTYLENACRNYLGMELGPFFPMDNTRDISDLYLWALDETTDLSERNRWAEEIKAFQELPDEKRLLETKNRLFALAGANCMPCIIDTGGMLDDNGRYGSSIQGIIEHFCSADDERYIAFIHRRKPNIYDLPDRDKVLFQFVNPLEDHSIMALLTHLLRKPDVMPDKRLLDSLKEHLGGYPPCAYFAANYIREYGISILTNNPEALVDFKARRFTGFLNLLSLSENEWLILRYLAGEEAIPFPIIQLVIDLDEKSVALILKNLIDNCLVIQINDNYYMSKPVKNAVFRIKKFLDQAFYKELATNITKSYWEDAGNAPSIEVVDATLHAIARSGSVNIHPYEDLIRPSTIHRLAQECYHKKEYELALQYAERTLQLDSRRADVRAIRFKSLVQLGKRAEAELALSEINQKGDRQYFYLKGFMLRKENKHKDAIKAFESALAIGDRNYAVLRDYAECLYRCGRLQEAVDKLNEVLKKDTENMFVLDLMVRICLDLKRLDDAKKWLSLLESVDYEERFVHHRKASFLAKKNEFVKALSEAEAACQTGRSPFEAYAQKIDILIELGRMDEARKDLGSLERQFSTHRRDIRNGLSCKLLIREGKWREAQQVWEQIDDKTQIVNQHLLLNILEMKSTDNSLTLLQRQEAEQEAIAIRDRLGAESEDLSSLPGEDDIEL